MGYMKGHSTQDSDIEHTLAEINDYTEYLYRFLYSQSYLRDYLKEDAIQSDVEYTLIASLETPSVNPGDQIKINVFFSGYGLPKRNKLTIIHTQPKMLDDSNNRVGDIALPIFSVRQEEQSRLVTGKLASWHKDITQANLDKAGGTVNLVDDYFLTPPGIKSPNEKSLPPISSEQVYDGHSPVEVTYDVSDNAAPGDYQIHIIFTYQSRDVTKQSSSIVEVHVNDRREQLEPWFTRVALASVGIALLSLFFELDIIF